MKYDGAVIISGGFFTRYIGDLRKILEGAKHCTKFIVNTNRDRHILDQKNYGFTSHEAQF